MMDSLRRMRITGVTPQKVEDICIFRLEPVSGPDSEVFSFIPGQFVQIHTAPEAISYFAIASPPDEGRSLEFLVKKGKGAAGALFGLGVGDEVEMTAPQGKGFPIDQYKGHNLLLIGVGTGIAPLRSVLRSALSRREEFGELIFVYGVLTPDHFCYSEEMEDWSRSRVQVHRTVTYPEGTGWIGQQGFVQDVLKGLRPGPENSVAMLVGMKEMVEENTRLLLELGFPKEKILLNY